jgi:ferritin-like metal-binding protein YciE
MVDTQQELFEHELRDIYDAEHKLVRALQTMSKKVPDRALAESFGEHRKVTEGQIQRLEGVFRLLDKKPRREPCRGINGLIDEFTKFTKEGPSDDVLNAFAVGAGLKVEQYEIVAYQSLLRMAGQLGLEGALDPLSANLSEEMEAANRLDASADQHVGPLASVLGMEEEPIVLPETAEQQVTLDEAAEEISIPPERPL